MSLNRRVTVPLGNSPMTPGYTQSPRQVKSQRVAPSPSRLKATRVWPPREMRVALAVDDETEHDPPGIGCGRGRGSHVHTDPRCYRGLRHRMQLVEGRVGCAAVERRAGRDVGLRVEREDRKTKRKNDGAS